MVDRDGKELKKKVLVMDLLLCGIQRVEKMEGSYKDGLKHGPSIMWHLNGMKWREQNHQNGKPVGVWKSWDDRGELLEEIVHEKIPVK